MYGDKLHLNNPMNRSYLIQRLSKPAGKVNPFSFGGGLVNGGLSKEAMGILTGIFSFDYMGATEFEWGAVPAALQFIAESADKKGVGVVSGQHQGVFYIAPKPYEAGVKAVIDGLLADEGTLRLEEYCGLKDAMDPKADRGMFYKNNVGWLELNNGFFMFTDHEMFENTKRLFGVK
jgi:hypothetical protein